MASNNFQGMCTQCKTILDITEVAYHNSSRAVYICCQCHIGGLVYHHQCPDGCFQVATEEELKEINAGEEK